MPSSMNESRTGETAELVECGFEHLPSLMEASVAPGAHLAPTAGTPGGHRVLPRVSAGTLPSPHSRRLPGDLSPRTEKALHHQLGTSFRSDASATRKRRNLIGKPAGQTHRGGDRCVPS